MWRTQPAARFILEIAHPDATNHNGGTLGFGADGYLYWTIGDGANQGNSQDLNSLLGKVLRLDVEFCGAVLRRRLPIHSSRHPSTIRTPAAEIWAYGLRNPYRAGIDRLTGDLYIGDVGDGTWEEIDYQPVRAGWQQLWLAHPRG